MLCFCHASLLYAAFFVRQVNFRAHFFDRTALTCVKACGFSDAKEIYGCLVIYTDDASLVFLVFARAFSAFFASSLLGDMRAVFLYVQSQRAQHLVAKVEVLLVIS